MFHFKYEYEHEFNEKNVNEYLLPCIHHFVYIWDNRKNFIFNDENIEETYNWFINLKDEDIKKWMSNNETKTTKSKTKKKKQNK